MKTINNIYLDYQATTPVDKRVIDKMLPILVKFMATHTLETTPLDGKLNKL